MKIEIPEKVEYILNRLMELGYEAYVVGGCVRDAILGRIPDDWDITTSAKPLEVKEIFQRTIDTGIQHGTVTVLFHKEGYEVTTYRIDGEYEDNRHPKKVEFTASLIEDLKRRDFTINAMAYNHIVGLVDEFNGLNDIKIGVIRCVGKAEERFDEDALRILRAIRFSAQLGFEVDEDTKEAIRIKVEHLKNISAERIRIELDKLITSNYPNKIIDAYHFGITKAILPEFDKMINTKQNNPHHIYNVGIHTMKAIEEIRFAYILEGEKDITEAARVKYFHILRWAMLLHDVAKPDTKTTSEDGIDHFYGHPEKSVVIAKKILKRLKFDNYTIETVTRIIKWHDVDFIPTPVGIRKQMNKIGEDIMMLLFDTKRADVLAQNPTTHGCKLELIEQGHKLYMDIIRKQECVSLKDLAINGSDLLNIGFQPGKELGNVLNKLLDKVLEDPSLNKKDTLVSLSLKMLGNP